MKTTGSFNILDTREAAMMDANDFQDSSGVLLSLEK